MEYKTRHDWVDHWELCKKFQFDHSNKCYVPKLESIQENKTRKILRDFDILTDYQILERRPDLVKK